MPSSGHLGIWSQLQRVESNYHGHVVTGLGWSGATAFQSSTYFMSVGEQLGAEEASYRFLHDSRNLDDDAEWGENIVMPGEFRTFNLTTDHVYSAGETILLRTGISIFKAPQ